MQATKVRYFRNSRYMVGFNAYITRNGKDIAEASHDGDCVVYSVRYLGDNAEEQIKNKADFLAWADKVIQPKRGNIKDQHNYQVMLETDALDYLLDQHDAKVPGK